MNEIIKVLSFIFFKFVLHPFINNKLASNCKDGKYHQMYFFTNQKFLILISGGQSTEISSIMHDMGAVALVVCSVFLDTQLP
jgi:hypothetical protein